MSRRRKAPPEIGGSRWWVTVVCTNLGQHGRIVLDRYVVALLPYTARPRWPQSTRTPTGWANGETVKWGRPGPGNAATLSYVCRICKRNPRFSPALLTLIENAFARTWNAQTRKGEIDISVAEAAITR